MINKYDLEVVRRSIAPKYAAKLDAAQRLEARGFQSIYPENFNKLPYCWYGEHELGEARVNFVIEDIYEDAHDWYNEPDYEQEPDLYEREPSPKIRTIFRSLTRDEHGTEKLGYQGESLDEAIKLALASPYLPPQIKFESKEWGMHPETHAPIAGPIARYAASVGGIVAKRDWHIIDAYQPNPQSYFNILLFSTNREYSKEFQVITDGTEFYANTGLGRIDEVQLTLYEAEREVILDAIRLFCDNM